MVRNNQSIRYQNVVKKRAFFHYTKMAEELEQLKEDIAQTGAKPIGPLTYAVLNSPRDRYMLVDFIMPVEGSVAQTEELEFQSFYSVEHMVSITVFENFEKETEAAYRQLLNAVVLADKEVCTPFYHVVDNSGEYLKVMIGYQNIKESVQ